MASGHEQELREGVQALIAECEGRADILARASCGGNLVMYSKCDTSAVFREAAGYLRRHLCRSMDLAVALNDMFYCLMQSQADEEAEASDNRTAFYCTKEKRRRQRQRQNASHQKYVKALSRAHAYGEVGEQVKELIDCYSDLSPLQAVS